MIVISPEKIITMDMSENKECTQLLLTGIMDYKALLKHFYFDDKAITNSMLFHIIKKTARIKDSVHADKLHGPQDKTEELDLLKLVEHKII